MKKRRGVRFSDYNIKFSKDDESKIKHFTSMANISGSIGLVSLSAAALPIAASLAPIFAAGAAVASGVAATNYIKKSRMIHEIKSRKQEGA
jgi:hypothetical protein